MAEHGKESTASFASRCYKMLKHITNSSTQGSPLRLINIKQMVNSFAVLGPKYCFVFALTSLITSNTCNIIKGALKPLVIAAYNIAQKVWKVG